MSSRLYRSLDECSEHDLLAIAKFLVKSAVKIVISHVM